ncbi:MAG TPA: NADH-quinone oxidoreductase subunit J [Actinomycetes bacterium]|nr:NADH-quinone oxidoreductase subunit J [Actinomycetes bacterium]
MSGLLAMSTVPGEIAFWILAIAAVFGALAMLWSRKAVHSALWLALTMISLAFMYILQDAVFLGIVQIVVYTGAVMMLFLFVLMLVGVDSSDSLVETLPHQRIAAVLVGLGFGLLLVIGLGHATLGSAEGLGPANEAQGGNVQGLAVLIFSRYVWVFEVTSALLIVAAVGAMVLAHRERLAVRVRQRELSEQRVRTGRPTPLAAPGVYARHNAVDTPGLLPDGSPSPESVPVVLSARPVRKPAALEGAGETLVAEAEGGES